MKFVLIALSLLVSTSAQAGLQTEMISYDSGVPFIGKVELRVGHVEAANGRTQKACVLYLEGLADSIANHETLFTALSDNGYRVVTFDYMGQGGSKGSMNHTRVKSTLFPGLDIQEQAKFVWSHYGCEPSRKFVIGWSTGGLASYRLAAEGWAEAIVAIAPGIHPNMFVGEGTAHPSKMILFQQVITERTLTRNEFHGQNNPHVDPIKPVSPMRVPLFAKNLLLTALTSHRWKIPSTVKGFVFLSGFEDTYVDRASTENTLAANAPHFSVMAYAGALHEIDNELPAIANDLIAKTIKFLDRSL
ncbi:hypothetical protein BH10BDE1_BH10BDE1_00520 [soil metagenome]